MLIIYLHGRLWLILIPWFFAVYKWYNWMLYRITLHWIGYSLLSIWMRRRRYVMVIREGGFIDDDVSTDDYFSLPGNEDAVSLCMFSMTYQHSFQGFWIKFTSFALGDVNEHSRPKFLDVRHVRLSFIPDLIRCSFRFVR